MTQFGCLYQGSCPMGYAVYNNSCVPSVNNGGYNNGGYNNGGYNNGCPAGSFNTVYGCLPQANCPNGQVLYQNRCYTLIQNNGFNYGAGFQFSIQW